MRALVTGANGLLGSNLVRELRADGHTVRAMVRKTSNLTGLRGVEVEMVHGDVRDADAMRAAADGCELMYHTAAVFSYWGYSKDEMYRTAEEGAVNAVDAAKDAGIKRLVLTSSTVVLGGKTEAVAINEDGEPNEGGPDYFKSKLVQEQAFLSRAKEVGLEAVACNPSLFIGPHDYRPSASLATITGYLMDPMKMTYPGGANVAHAADVARGHIIVGEKGRPGERHILASPDNQAWPEIHGMISELCGIRGPGPKIGRTIALAGATMMELLAYITRKPPQATRGLAGLVGQYFWYDIDKALSLGYSPRSTRETLASTIAWLLDSPHMTLAQQRRLKPAPEVDALRPNR